MSAEVAPTTRWVENAAPRSRFGALRLGDVWRYRELAVFFAIRDIKVKYKQALLGILWAFLQPLVGAAAFTLVFNNLAQIDVEGRSYFAFALAGFAGWGYISTAFFSGTSSLLANANLLSKVSFPRILLPLAAMLPPLVDLAVGSVITVIAAVILGDGFSVVGFVAGFPCGLALMMTAVAGPMLFVSALVARYRDVSSIAAYCMQFMMFASPVAYPPELVPEDWQGVYFLNPVAGALGLLRAALINADFPSGMHLLQSSSVAIVMLVGGLVYFQSSSRTLADVI